MPHRTLSALLLLAAACGEPTTPGPPVTPPLEAVNFALLGSAKVMFYRIGDIASGRSYSDFYIIDAAIQTSSILETEHTLGGTLSPNGSNVALLLWTDFTTCWDVYTIDLQGANRSRISSFTCNGEGVPAWTPAGNVVYATSTLGSTPEFSVNERLPTGQTSVLRSFRIGPGEPFRCPFATPWRDLGPVSVSNAGSITYSCEGREIVSLRLPDSVRTVYTAGDSSTVYHPAWSNDGNQIAFMELIHGPDHTFRRSVLRILSITTGSVRDVASIPATGQAMWYTGSALSVCWLPNGRLLFSAVGVGGPSTGAPRGALHIVNADGTGLVRFTTREDSFDHAVSCTR